jgi:ATP-binding cassette subfamily B protein
VVSITDSRMTGVDEPSNGLSKDPGGAAPEEPGVALLDPLRASALMEQMNGRFESRPSSDASGVSFVMRLPLRAVVESGPRPQAETPNPLQGLAAFVVDDHDEARALLGDVLDHRGAHTERYASGAEVLAALRGRPDGQWPDVLVCDIALGEIDGHEVIREIRRIEEQRKVPLARRLPAVALSGNTATEDRLRALLAGFQIYMAKPIDPRELVAAVLALTRGGRERPPRPGD